MPSTSSLIRHRRQRRETSQRGFSRVWRALASIALTGISVVIAALVIAGITDSKNRTSNEVKLILKDNNGTLGGPNSTMWAFASARNEEGEIIYSPISTIPLSPEDSEKLKSLVAKLEENDDIRAVFSNAI